MAAATAKQQWTGFDGKMMVAGWAAIAIEVFMVFMGLTYILLPTSATARHYLTTLPMIGFVLVSVRSGPPWMLLCC